MAEDKKPPIGAVTWIDLTVGDAERIKEFYGEVVGWQSSGVEMEGYEDYNMIPPGQDGPVAGICHARGVNAAMPPQWMLYVTVADVDASAKRCVELGGDVVVEPKALGSHGRYCVIRDPAGAVSALFQPAG